MESQFFKANINFTNNFHMPMFYTNKQYTLNNFKIIALPIYMHIHIRYHKFSHHDVPPPVIFIIILNYFNTSIFL